MQEAGAGRITGQPWSDDETRQHLQVLVEGVAVLAGFEQAAISLRLEDEFEVVACAGEGLAETIMGRRLPSHLVEGELATADEWGAWLFVPHERVSEELIEHSFIPEVSDVEGPDAWHPLDTLTSPVRDDDGVIRGLLSVDVPHDGRRPGPDQLALLQKYAGLARTLVLLALERGELSERVRITAQAREIVRQALGEPSLRQVIEACRSTVVECFDALGMWLTAFDEEGGSSTVWYAEGAEVDPLFSEIDDVVMRLAHRYWADQYVAPFSWHGDDQPGLPPQDAERLLTFLDGLGIGSVLFVPLGAGPECMGFLCLTRAPGNREWSDVECDAARDIGRDLGRAVANARQLERERAVADRLRMMDGYRLELVNTLGHELRTPLFSMTANLEMLDVDSLADEDQRSVAAANRAAARMQAVIEDLLNVAQVADPLHEFVPERVDLRQTLLDVAEECHHAAIAKGQTCDIKVPDEPVAVSGRPEELHRMLANLASNAIKYSHEGGTINAELVHEGDGVRVTFEDSGIGITEADQRQLFREFFRSTNPDALARPGTGLGLAIVDRIVRRHSGSVALASEFGKGTTVTVNLPSYDDDEFSRPAPS
ncbi:signal transduction histidine kinase [Nocardioides sp. BE266]|uniref:sensor histidine kinase n=1 Tax=Nocardioides sp. BE266 TaxID=2817725 RepID=UPI00285F5B79|nr:GAF domain-containing sensor histidine kinase [Nocardioides sp. BE266]MDR7251947.1 signal transduction histidine kinase [Nocardioides sp. BE266]